MTETQSDLPISLIRGGTVYWVQEKARLIQPNRWSLGRRLPVAIGIARLPLVVLTAIHSGTNGDLYTLLRDYRVYARVFVAIPLLILGQITMESHFREMSQHFLDADLVRMGDLSRFRAIMEKARRLRDARLPEIAILIAVFVQIGYFLHSGKLPLASWAIQPGSDTPTPAGYYSLFVGHALFLSLLGLAFWKWIIWIVVLWNLSRLDLQLDSTDGDLAGGLGFLGEIPKSFVPAVLAISSVIGATWRWRVVEGAATLGSYKLPAALLAILVVLIFFLPLVLFTPKLIREKKEGNLSYGSLRHLHSLQFREKWMARRKVNVGELLGTADVSSLADMSTSFKNVEDMVVFPFQKGAAIALLAGLALPMIPALTAKIPLKELLKSLLEALH